ncbi:TPA: recombinase family protein [Klebsiella aerogenes]|uniref:Transposon Tn552 DNA-invertase bin3 n=1 Tax=Pseudocitrobacter corydidari TaxID=2891570 RepID=A0ABY3SBV4_9ENTR|nr:MULTISPECIES: recombinase family protein [Enterobacteriaceae]CAE6362750.1 Putative transposon Tn552 DNA-invertase bin3 [Enterobacter cloacae]HDG9807411.1 recombinase family protein [Raoultella planticola]HDS3649074.1 recombinase family protein [Enterobacter hormaechei subsp. steigerwaltii]EKW5209512.1 recombinase family protein [Klebsiella aerogenes]ELS4537712.1 recombinase family protein [Klebsiella aerogenes]
MNSNRIYAYLRASTKDQNAERARQDLQEFATSNGVAISAWFIENESGASLARPELMKLLDIAQSGDVLLVEQVDRLSRLNAEDWEKLTGMIKGKGVRVVALDLPTSHMMVNSGDEFTTRMMQALNSMMLDMLAAIARKDHQDRKRRQAQGIKLAKAEGKFKGRQIDTGLHERVLKLRDAGWSYTEIQKATNVARTTISRIIKTNLKNIHDNII